MQKRTMSADDIYDCYIKGLNFTQISAFANITPQRIRDIVNAKKHSISLLNNELFCFLYNAFDKNFGTAKRYYGVCRRYNIIDIKQLLALTDDDIYKMRGITIDTFYKIRRYANDLR